MHPKALNPISFSKWLKDRLLDAPIDGLVDTTGAGDLFAAGFMAGQVQGRTLEQSLRMGSIAAAEIFSH